MRVAAAAEREAEDPDRSIQAIGVASAAAGTIEVIWGTPGDTDTLNSFRVMWPWRASITHTLRLTLIPAEPICTYIAPARHYVAT